MSVEVVVREFCTPADATEQVTPPLACECTLGQCPCSVSVTELTPGTVLMQVLLSMIKFHRGWDCKHDVEPGHVDL